MTITLHHGDALDVLAELKPESVDAVVADPPYGLAEHKPATIVAAMTAWCSGDRDHVPDGRGFMGRAWDGFVPPPAVWDECLRVLKPGGHIAVFAAPRTVDLMGISIRLAGFEIRDAIGAGLLAWVQGQGFPKGKTHLKPAWEPIIVARKPLAGTVAATVQQFGTGALNIDGCRVASTEPIASHHGTRNPRTAMGGGWHDSYQPGDAGKIVQTTGRWPANVVLTHAPCCGEACVDGCPVAELDAQSGTLTSGGAKTGAGGLGGHGIFGASDQNYMSDDRQRYDSGGASRFFPTFRYQAKTPTSERPKIDGKGWPTVKPLALMRWLVRLVTPPGGVVLDPFAGTGPTLQAAELEGFNSLGIERDEFAYALAGQRLGITYPASAGA